MEQLKGKIEGKLRKRIILYILIILVIMVGTKLIIIDNNLMEMLCVVEEETNKLLCKDRIIVGVRNIKQKKNLIKIKSRRYKYVNCKLAHHYKTEKLIFLLMG